MLYTVFLVSEVLLSIALITLILMQHGKGADAGAAFGGGGGGASGTVFGSQGAANFLSRTTAVLATAFFINCMGLAYLVAHREEAVSIFDTVTEQTESGAATSDTSAAPAIADTAADIPEIESKPAPADIPEAADIPAAGDSGSSKKSDIPE
ncbi:MAG TPA: preprotein translocase subunit SecG [Gammaproteobacteria bacterium]|nr:preprotein translocase subunit SecG [Gammaproteobacteria bacterium]